MKISPIPFICSALLVALPASAQEIRQSSDRLSLAIIQTEDPVFPLSLITSSVLKGDARVAIDVDEKGQLTDCLVTGYSRKEFADAAVAVIKRWRYLPPLVNGQPWSSVKELRFDYSRTGVVVSFSGMEAMADRIDELLQGSLRYRTYALRDLDRIPTPIHVVSPASPPPEPANRANHSVTVEFFIDEQGVVRLPSVSRAEVGTQYAACALTAVRQWRFDPPLVKGRPALVLVNQQFNFVPEKS
jgi:TonB family protein